MDVHSKLRNAMTEAEELERRHKIAQASIDEINRNHVATFGGVSSIRINDDAAKALLIAAFERIRNDAGAKLADMAKRYNLNEVK